MSFLLAIIATVCFAVLAPIVGCLLAGVDRVVSAKMQGRVGPPLLQPYYDVRKLLEKDDVSINGVDGMYMNIALVFTCFAGGIFFSGGNLLMSSLVITMAALMFIVAAYSSRSPYAEVGAGRETIAVMAYEPMVFFFAIAFYLATGSFDAGSVFAFDAPVITVAWLAFIGFLFILTIKLRKSPFDLSMAEHAHQELVRGMTTEMSGKTLAKVEIMHWCETVLFLGWCGLFFVWGNALSLILAIVVAIILFLFEIWVDNNFARVKWQLMLKSAWIVALVCGVLNIGYLMYF